MSSIKITTSQNIDIEYELASLGERIAGAILDDLIKYAYIFLLVVMSVYTHFADTLEAVYIIIIFLPYCFYTLASEIFMNGQTLGKRILNIRVVSLDGGQATTGQYVIRWLFMPIDFYFTFYSCAVLTVAFSTRHQRLGDMIAGTIVIKTTPRVSFQQTVFVPPVQIPDYTVTFPEVVNLTDQEIQLVKEVILMVRTNGNHAIASQAAEKIKQTINVQSSLDPMSFLHTLLADYNYLASRE